MLGWGRPFARAAEPSRPSRSRRVEASIARVRYHDCASRGGRRRAMTRTSRRRLLAGTLGSSLMAQVEAPPEVRLPRKIRLALAGFDGHPEEILRVLPQLPDVELVAVAGEESDPDAQANALKDRYAANARRYATLAQLLAAEPLDTFTRASSSRGLKGLVM